MPKKPPINAHTEVSCRVRGLILVCVFIYIHTLCLRATKSLMSLSIGADSPELPLLINAI